MRRSWWLESAWPKIVRSTVTFTLAIGALAVSAAAEAGAPPNGSRNHAVEAKAQIATKFMVMDRDTISSPLPEGDTTFIIFLAQGSTLERFTFINESQPARGELRIAVANERLSAESDKWRSVDGPVSFKHKRLFNVSMLGVEAKYLRLAFHIEHEENVGRVTGSEALARNKIVRGG